MKASGATSGWGHCQLGRLRPAAAPSDSLRLLEVPRKPQRKRREAGEATRSEAVGKAAASLLLPLPATGRPVRRPVLGPQL